MTGLRPQKLVSATGKVHRRRLRYWVGTEHETLTEEDHVQTLCGMVQDWEMLTPAPKGAVVDCKVCIASCRTKAHLRG